MHFQTVSRGENETKAKSLANHQSCQPHAMLTPKLLKGPSFLWPLDNNMMDNFPDDSRHISENSRALKTSLLFFRGNSIFRVGHTLQPTYSYVFYINIAKNLGERFFKL